MSGQIILKIPAWNIEESVGGCRQSYKLLAVLLHGSS
jgi:hypothetical protein